MHLDTRVKVIALVFLSVLVDTRLRQRLRAGKMDEGRCRLLRGTAPVLDVLRGGAHPKGKASVPCNKLTTHRAVKQ
jgi:hypothetical protein